MVVPLDMGGSCKCSLKPVQWNENSLGDLVKEKHGSCSTPKRDSKCFTRRMMFLGTSMTLWQWFKCPMLYTWDMNDHSLTSFATSLVWPCWADDAMFAVSPKKKNIEHRRHQEQRKLERPFNPMASYHTTLRSKTYGHFLIYEKWYSHEIPIIFDTCHPLSYFPRSSNSHDHHHHHHNHHVISHDIPTPHIPICLCMSMIFPWFEALNSGSPSAQFSPMLFSDFPI